jgi:hypothetical protein
MTNTLEIHVISSVLVLTAVFSRAICWQEMVLKVAKQCLGFLLYCNFEVTFVYRGTVKGNLKKKTIWFVTQKSQWAIGG